ncbi:D-alanyl-D-alanine carboxypeptidase/D-alanyl-D-alanine endopeptidase [Rhodohalobacter sulfatireducens]|uniref:D-alanyl-D-alanine carboxypeptidase/D-alanyl-D-alanine-endopeptidase n=1 Tax=Rhodohalobacter sulfatireducens TaxID=2911366 RepID=A0ABS9KF24_9BACT|nr:D-alanyl-D-alanine carboxypeptidase/D-alanyl-D-alanine-endopeptidase [Rhodohalobacter sulfatireducens]MCG2589449.1 D-alanyl-D-alanine carboxypeptidase/D-alanyl-D-alanine-endopeptidase [Rhodohalobacter sulfatireducens]MDR9363732.1 D-alanyl-D-alanine carboxypeptidase/D-alanyl-D-alanine-endopeptidase [Balneolaceae bacterium]MDR9408133.1 D-alanyl-D-alanine carboxypeptidase/D-alanyl-D-alanine-endopeptidase [Balneolaceae bacterium]
MKTRTALFGLITCLLLLFFSADANAQISEPILNLIENNRAENALWVVQVRDSSGSVLESYNADKIIRPASNLKLISSGAYLEFLGADYKFRTRLYGEGEQAGDTWSGDMVVQGSGDPSISGEFYQDNPLFLFEKWADLLIDKGIQKIDGNLIGHTGLFDDIPYPEGWEWSDLSFYYAPEISALSFNGNVVNLEVVADGPVGSAPEIQWFPFNTPYVEFINEQQITPRGSKYDESYRRVLGTNTIILRSTLPQGYYETEPLSILEPAYYFMDTFKRYLVERGVEVTGQIFIDHNYEFYSENGLQLLDEHQSEPLHELIQWMNRESDNFYTEMFLKKAVTEVYGVQGSTDLGLEMMKSYMQEMAFDTSQVSLKDASGMAPATLLKASDLNRYLLKVQEKEYFPYLYESLSVGGRNGTLSYRFNNSPVWGNFNGKTGFVTGVRSLSGYLETESGQRLIVSIFTNNYTAKTSHVDLIHQRILEYLHSAY